MLSNEMTMAVNEFLRGDGLTSIMMFVFLALFAIAAIQNINLRNESDHLKRQLLAQPKCHLCSAETSNSSQQEMHQR